MEPKLLVTIAQVSKKVGKVPSMVIKSSLKKFKCKLKVCINIKSNFGDQIIKDLNKKAYPIYT